VTVALADVTAGTRLEGALVARLHAVAPQFGLSVEQCALVGLRGPGAFLDVLVRIAKARRAEDLLWLLIVGVTAAFPSADQLRMTRRALELAAPAVAMTAFLEACFDSAARFSDLDKEIDVVVGGVIVDVDFCANHVHNTGIQRVVRQTMARWAPTRDLHLVAWTAGGGSMRSLSAVERSRVTEWNTYTEPRPDQAPTDPPGYRIVVPYAGVVVLPEVPQAALCEPLAALAEFSGNKVGLVGYDAIPVVSADTLPSAETERFVRYLTILKHSDRVVGISDAATEEFAGFGDTLAAQGLTAPTTLSVRLPVDLPDERQVGAPTDTSSPLVLCVGSQEPRKNHRAILFAAEMLWREGLQFRLRFVGGGSLSYTRDFDRRIRGLRKEGRAVEVLRGVNDAVLLASYREARFTVFPSLHEGYGLPVAESLAQGVPVITTSYGSTAEIAADGGCIAVDPRDDDQLINAMRSLLVDDVELDRLLAECRSRPAHTWDEYADELWNVLVEPLRSGHV
jgi:glycosyltransferase involved in cell wall biosynthesis